MDMHMYVHVYTCILNLCDLLNSPWEPPRNVLIINHCDTQGGVTPLIVAAEWGQTEVARQLLEAGANTNFQDEVQDHFRQMKRYTLHTCVCSTLYMYMYRCTFTLSFVYICT